MASRSRKRPEKAASRNSAEGVSAEHSHSNPDQSDAAGTAESTKSEAGKTEDVDNKDEPRRPKVHEDVYNGDTDIEVDGIRIDLKNRFLAAFLAWLLPGAGHYYQGRNAKGTLYLASILSIWVLGFALGGGHVVYASWQPGDKRWHYFLQAGVGAAALPALVQSYRLGEMTQGNRTQPGFEPWWGGFMSPPRRPVIESDPDEVSAWYARSGAGYELGTWFTMIAGLLNVLVIYDAFGGPLAVPISGRSERAAGTKAKPTG